MTNPEYGWLKLGNNILRLMDGQEIATAMTSLEYAVARILADYHAEGDGDELGRSLKRHARCVTKLAREFERENAGGLQ